MLTQWTSPRGHTHSEGQAKIFVEWDWRVEARERVLFGSSDSGALLHRRIPELQGRVIESIEIVGELPELRVGLSEGWWFQTMVMTAGDPQWNIRTLDGERLNVVGGKICMGAVASEPTPEETAAFVIAESTAMRWSKVRTNVPGSACGECVAFVPLDGHGALLDFGCCRASASPFDGRAVHRDAGCEVFERG